VLGLGGALEAIVPAVEYRTWLPDSTRARYDSLFASARTVHRCPFRESNAKAHMAASRFMVDEADHVIAVWGGEPARAFGGTADVVAYARAKGRTVTVIWPAGATR
jgi:predicted flavoprotein YhiN